MVECTLHRTIKDSYAGSAKRSFCLVGGFFKVNHLLCFVLFIAPKFQQADYPINQWAEQFIYVDFGNIDWDPVSDTWKQIPYSK